MIEVLGGLGRSPEYLDTEIRPEGDGVWVGLTVGPEIVDDRGNPHHGEALSPKRSAYAIAMANASINDEGRWN